MTTGPNSTPFQFQYSALETVNIGENMVAAIPALAASYGAASVFILASGTLSRSSQQFQALRTALGERYAGLFDRIASHTPRADVLLALGTVAHGASHGIGYILGSLCDVPHGYTSCVMLPAVLEWNSQENGDRQQAIAAALGKPSTSAATAVRELVGLPTTLTAIGVSTEQLPEIARRAISHPVVRKNPRKLESAEQVLEILALAL